MDFVPVVSTEGNTGEFLFTKFDLSGPDLVLIKLISDAFTGEGENRQQETE